MKILKTIFLASLFCLNIHAEDAPLLEVSDSWVRPSVKNPNAAAYMSIKNPNNFDVVITNVICDVANKTEMHQSIDDRGVMKMVSIDKLAVPAGETVVLKPKGLHIMLMKLKNPLKEGENIKLTLMTEDNKSIELSVPVVNNN